jgi:hypothetical protein
LKREEILEARRVASKSFFATVRSWKCHSTATPLQRYSTVEQLRDPAIQDAVDEDEDEDDATSNGPALANEAALYAKAISATENSQGLRPAARASRRYNLTTMAEYVLLVSARDIHHHCGGLGGLIALVVIQVCEYQLLRRNDKGDFECDCSGVIGGTDDQLALQSPIAMVGTRAQAIHNSLFWSFVLCSKSGSRGENTRAF